MHKHWKEEELLDVMRRKYNTLFPDIAFDSEKLAKRYKNYPGLKGDPNYQPFPGIKGTDIRMLRFAYNVMKDAEDIAVTYDDDEILPYPNIAIKDISRLGNLMSLDVNPSYPGYSTLVDQQYDDKFRALAEEFIDYVMSGSGMRFDTYVSKDRESSNGAGLRTNDIPSFAYMIDTFIENMGKDDFNKQVYDTPNFLFLLTRRMAKPLLKPDGELLIKKASNKDGELLIHDRSLPDSLKEKMEKSGIESKYFGRALHRAANNVQEIERMTQFIVQAAIEAIKDTYPIIFKTHDGFIKQLVEKENLFWCCSDASKFDQSIPQWMIDRMCVNLTKLCDGLFDFVKLEHSKDIVWWDEEKQRFTSLTTLCKEHVKSAALQDHVKEELLNRSNIIGLSSGNPFTNPNGKFARSLTEYVILKRFFKPSLTPDIFLSLDFEIKPSEVVEAFTKEGLTPPIALKDTSRFLFVNSSDDNASAFTSREVRDLYQEILMYNMSLDIKKFLPVEQDPEFLADVKNADLNDTVIYAGNLMRKSASLICPEYSAEVSDGIYKDYRLSLASKKEMFMQIPYGDQFWNLINNRFKEQFDYTMEEYVNRFLKDKVTVTDTIVTSDVLSKYVDNPAVKEYINNHDKIYYVDWIREQMPEEVMKTIFYNIGPDKTYEFYKKRNKEQFLLDMYNTYSENITTLDKHVSGVSKTCPNVDIKSLIHYDKLVFYRTNSKFVNLSSLEGKINRIKASEKYFLMEE